MRIRIVSDGGVPISEGTHLHIVDLDSGLNLKTDLLSAVIRIEPMDIVRVELTYPVAALDVVGRQGEER